MISRIAIKRPRTAAAITAAIAAFPLFAASRARAGLVITPTFDSTITDDVNGIAIENIIEQAIQVYEYTFVNPINVTIDYEEMTSGLGESNVTYYAVPYSTFYTDLKNEGTSAADATAVANLPNSTKNPINGSTNIDMKVANIAAMGISGNYGSTEPGGYDGIVGLNTSLTTPPNAPNTGNYSLLATAEHETDEILGLGSGLPTIKSPFPEDLYRYTSSGSRSFTTSGDNAYFSIDGTTDLARFNQNSSGDYGDWWSTGTHTPQVQDAFGTPNAMPTLGVNEITALNVIGYNIITQTSTWNTGSSNWSGASNWTATGVPTTGDSVYITPSDGAARAINYDYTGAAVTLNTFTVDLTNFSGTAASTVNMTTNKLTADMEFVGYNGAGNFNQTGGTNTQTSPDGLFVAYNATSTGTYFLSGTGTLSAAGPENIGNGGTGYFIQSGGLNSIVGGSNAMLIGSNPGATGYYTMTAGSLSAANEIAGNLGFGGITQSGGINNVTGTLGLALGNAPGASGSYTLTAGTLTAAGFEYVGYQGNGSFNQTGGSNSIIGGVSALFLGYIPGSTGVYNFSGGTLSETFSEDVGFYGTGAFVQSGGVNTIASGFNINLGYDAGSDGSYSLSAGTITVGSGVYVGGSSHGAGSVGNLYVSGGVMNIGTTLTVWTTPSSGITLSGGTINTPALDLNGVPSLFDWTGGTLNFINSTTFDSTATNTTSGGAFGSALTLGANQTLLLTGNETIAGPGNFSLTLNSGATNIITGNNTLNIAANTGSTGTYTISGGALFAPSASVGGSTSAAGGAGTLSVLVNGSLTVTGALKVWNKGVVSIATTSNNVGSLSIVGTGIVNMNGSLRVNFGTPAADPVNTILSYLTTGYNGGNWSGTSGIISTSAAASVGSATLLAVGYNDGNTDTADAAAPNTILIKMTLAGDANLDGTVDFTDLFAVGQYLNTTGNDWAEGNFNYSAIGAVDFSDLFLIGQNLNQTINSPIPLGEASFSLAGSANIQTTTAVPEPLACPLFAAAAIGLLSRRRRRREEIIATDKKSDAHR